ncbi:TonB-dependent receptor [Stenotrophomonas sp. S39]|nr:TonB-dependent receptor [Stenotrophomonas sp. S39]
MQCYIIARKGLLAPLTVPHFGNPHLNRTEYLVASLLASAIALALAAPAAGQEAQPSLGATSQGSPRSDEPTVTDVAPVMVTGTRFNGRLITESPVPVDSVSREDLRRTASPLLEDQLKVQVPSFSIPRPSTAGAVDFYTAPSLRGLSPGQLLVLINGKRRHASGDLSIHNQIGRGDVAYDLNAIPSAALERVEVLRDGASAQYGSDAIAGVINLQLARDLGAGADTSYSVTDQGDGQTLDTNAWVGLPVRETGFFRATVSYRKSDGTNRAKEDTRQQYFGGNGSRMPSGNFGSGTGLTPSNGVLDPREATVDRNTFRLGEPEYRQKSIFLNSELPLTETVDLYLFGGYSRLNGESVGFARRAGQDETVRALHPDGYSPTVQADLENRSLAVGVKGQDLGGFAYDISTVYGESLVDSTQVNSNNPSMGAGSPTSSYRGGTRFGQWTTNLDFTKELNVFQASPMKLAFGYEFRREAYELVHGDVASYLNGGVPILDGPNAGKVAPVGFQANSGIVPEEARKESRHSHAGYIEAEQNWGPLLVSGAIRHERYSDFGNTTNYKLASRFELSQEWALRASVSTGFRAPQLPQSYFATTSMTIVNGAQTSSRLLPVGNSVAQLLGAKALRPEKSDNVSLGLVYNSDAIAASVDVYQIKLKDRIALSSTFQGAAVGRILTDNGFAGVSSVSYLTNAVDTTTRGVDLTVRYQKELSDASRFVATFSGNYNKQEFDHIAGTPDALTQLGVTTPLFDLTQQVRVTDSMPRDKMSLDLGWEKGDWEFHFTNTRYGKVGAVAFTSLTQAQIGVLAPGYSTNAVAIEGSDRSQLIQYFSAKIISDLAVTYKPTKNWVLSVGVNNLFDVYPDKNIASTVESVAAGTNGSDNVGIFPYNYISPFGYSGKTYFARAQLRF